MLNTREPLPLESDVIVEIVPPGSVAPIAISSRVSYQVPSGGTGSSGAVATEHEILRHAVPSAVYGRRRSPEIQSVSFSDECC